MKRSLKMIIVPLIAAMILFGCASTAAEETVEKKVLKIGTTSPLKENYSFFPEKLAGMGYEAELVIFDDSVAPNTAVVEGTLDITIHQHTGYLQAYNDSNGTNLVACEPYISVSAYCIITDKYDSMDEIPSGAKVGISDDLSNMHRNLVALEMLGLIELAEVPSDGDNYTTLDVVSNPNQYEFVAMSWQSKYPSLPDLDFIIDGMRIASMQPGYRVLETTTGFLKENPELLEPGAAVVAYENKDAPWVQDVMDALCGDELRETLQAVNDEIGKECILILF